MVRAPDHETTRRRWSFGRQPAPSLVWELAADQPRGTGVPCEAVSIGQHQASGRGDQSVLATMSLHRGTQTEDRPIPILLYHSIGSCSTARFRPFALDPRLFTDHMEYLRSAGYQALTVTQLASALDGSAGALPNRPVVVTFDDGFADFHTNALPVLDRLHIPATLYVTTGFVDDTSRWLRREGETTRPMLSWSQLGDVCASGVECGAHGHRHPQLDVLPLDAARADIVKSKNLLEERLSREIHSFAYPFGYYTARVRRSVCEAGFTSACAVRFALSKTSDDRFALARLLIRADTNVAALSDLMSGCGSPILPTLTRTRTRIWQLARQGLASLGRRAETDGSG
jgi:peptidoglycan/xylan/chitin deacetylase (PgdA/CDA1 family)